MKTTVTVLLVAALAVSGCNRIRESRINPFNWFGNSQEVAVAEGAVPGIPDDGRILVAQVIDMDVARQPGGAIVTATGLPPTQGYWQADLVAENGGRPDENGVLTYRFVVAEPPVAERVSTPQSREVTAASYLSDIRLAEIGQIVVMGALNSRSSRR